MLNILWRNMKWRFENPLSIVFTIIQPLLWLIMYSSVASHTMQGLGIENYTAFILPGFFMSSLSYSLSLMLPNEVIYETIMNATVLPLFFLSTALFPLQNLSGTLRTVVLLNPFTHVINLLRNLMLENTISLPDVLHVVLLFTILCFGSFILAMWRLKKETIN